MNASGALETVTRCPLCACASVAAWATSPDHEFAPNGPVYPYSRCRDCGTVFAARRPAPEQMGHHYPERYAPHADAGAQDAGGIHSRITRWVSRASGAAAFASWLEQYYVQACWGRRSLDFGCGGGAFLQRARERGGEPVGMDFSARVLETLRARGFEVHAADEAGWRELPDAGFAFARANHVLEHLHDPLAALRQLRRKLASDGRLHLALPNPASWSARLFRGQWFALDAPRHLILPPPAVVASLLEQAGFRDVSLQHEPVTKDIVRSAARALARLGVVSADRATRVRPDSALACFAALPARLAAAAQRSERVHYFAAA